MLRKQNEIVQKYNLNIVIQHCLKTNLVLPHHHIRTNHILFKIHQQLLLT